MASNSNDENIPNASGRGDASVADPSQVQGTLGPLSGKLGIFIFVVLFSTAGYLTWHTLTHGEQAKPDSPPITYMCSETMKTFERKPVMNETIPVMSPYTNHNTGYPAEMCFWTRDGKQKAEPTYVLLNEHLGKKGPTICPDCGKIVYPHNPSPPLNTPLASQPAESIKSDAAPPASAPSGAP